MLRIIAITCIFFFSCTEKVTTAQNFANGDNDVVITIKNENPQLYKFNFDEKTWLSKAMSLHIVDGDDVTSIMIIDKMDSTITFECDNRNIVMRLAINYFEFNDYIFESGDSATIAIDNEIPSVVIHNRKVKKIDYQFDSRNINGTFSNFGYFNNASLFYAKRSFGNKSKNTVSSKIDKFLEIESGSMNIQKEYGNILLGELDSKIKLLNTEKQNENISELNFKFYTDKILNEILCIKIKLGIVDSLNYSKAYSELSSKAVNDYLRYNPTDSFYEKYYLSKTPPVPVGMGIKRDYKNTFDLVLSSTVFNNEQKDYLLIKLLSQIAMESPVELKKYFQRYQTSISDKDAVEKMNKRFRLILNPSINSSELELQGLTGEIINLKQLVESFKGKPIYVDFWASWCAPCLAEIPTSININTGYKEKAVFIYLSMDDDTEKWQKSVTKTTLNSSENNYVVLNKSTSSFIKENKVSAIPRYLLFDKRGNLVSSNAPRPSDIKLIKMLDSLIKQE